MSENPRFENKQAAAESSETLEGLLREHDRLHEEWKNLSQRIDAAMTATRELLAGPLSDEMLEQLERLDSELSAAFDRESEIVDRQSEIELRVSRLLPRPTTEPGATESGKDENHAPDRLERTRGYYDKARAKAEAVLRELDPELQVSVVMVDVKPDSPARAAYDTLALKFFSLSRPDLKWTMEVKESDEYIDGRLAEVVKAIYRDKVKALSAGNPRVRTDIRSEE